LGFVKDGYHQLLNARAKLRFGPWHPNQLARPIGCAAEESASLVEEEFKLHGKHCKFP